MPLRAGSRSGLDLEVWPPCGRIRRPRSAQPCSTAIVSASRQPSSRTISPATLPDILNDLGHIQPLDRLLDGGALGPMRPVWSWTRGGLLSSLGELIPGSPADRSSRWARPHSICHRCRDAKSGRIELPIRQPSACVLETTALPAARIACSVSGWPSASRPSGRPFRRPRACFYARTSAGRLSAIAETAPCVAMKIPAEALLVSPAKTLERPRRCKRMN